VCIHKTDISEISPNAYSFIIENKKYKKDGNIWKYLGILIRLSFNEDEVFILFKTYLDINKTEVQIKFFKMKEFRI